MELVTAFRAQGNTFMTNYRPPWMADGGYKDGGRGGRSRRPGGMCVKCEGVMTAPIHHTWPVPGGPRSNPS